VHRRKGNGKCPMYDDGHNRPKHLVHANVNFVYNRILSTLLE
jgi:hypothetical protein